MKYPLLFSFLLLIGAASAQDITRPVRLKSGTLNRLKNLRNDVHFSDSLKKFHYKNRFYTLVQFNKLPDAAERQALAKEGILLFDYIPDNTFLAEINDQLPATTLKKNNIAGVYTLDAKNKIAADLTQQLKQSMHDPAKLIAVSIYGNISKAEAITELKDAGARIIETKIQPAHVVFIDASANAVQKIAALPFVAYVSSQQMKPVAINYKNRQAHSVNILNLSSGRNLQGSGVTLGVGDDGDASSHIDFNGRLINRNPASPAWHGTHTMGTMAGAGFVNPKYKGMAPQATIVGQYFSDILVNSPYYVNDYNMVLTNNSYHSAASGCSGEGQYDVLSNYVDEQMISEPSLLHVFASGNDGALTCSPYPAMYGTVKSGFQTGKNVLTVGSVNNSAYVVSTFSSSGPVADGRIKPEIVAGGTNIASTTINNAYGASSGTSMAAPTVTGTLGLLYERYRQLHGGANPSSALIKAIACNTADDFGNAGPDFIYGFGNLNGFNAVQAIENNYFFNGIMNTGGTGTFTIPSVPAGASQLKIMLYWNDPAAAAYAATTLVNNLDLTVTTPDATTHYPLILNPASGSVTNVATEGVDSRNNIEQVVINNPPSGNFTVTVNGTSIPQGPQSYVVVYQIVTPELKVLHPFGEETLVPGETEVFRWSATDPNTSNFTIEYSIDNGSTWTIIDNNVSTTSRVYTWTLPSPLVATNALVRVSRNNGSYSDVSDHNFVILDTTTITVTNTCPGYANITWGAVTDATSYDIMMLNGTAMQTVATTTGTSYLLGGLNKDSTYWLAVRAVAGTAAGRRSIAKSVVPSGGACASPTFDNDLTPDSLVAPVTGRMYTSTQLGSVAPQVRIKNLSTVASSGSFNISYQVNGGSIITETSTQSIAAASTYTHTFATPFDFSNTGTYTVKAWVDYSSDTLNLNDTLTTTIKQLQNDPVTLSPSYVEDFETATEQTNYSATLGFEGLDRCDFTSSTVYGRARTFINTGIARSGNRAVTLDQKYSGSATADSLITTFNLSNYLPTDQLWLTFYYRNQGIDFSAGANRIWIRGSENDSWLPVYTLPYTSSDFGVYRAITPINITETLASAFPAQTISSSFQIRFGEQGYRSANSVIPDGNLDDGFTYDDITITLATDDVAMLQLVSPVTTNVCAMSNAETVTIQVKNYSASTLNNVPVSYQINNGTIVTENIPSIAAGATVDYTFTQTANLLAYQQYTLTTWVRYATDNYTSNDTTSTTFHTAPLISSFPYLEGFETSAGDWYTGGINSSWQWGQPAATIINKAANGTNAWVTNLTGNHNNYEYSYLYSPCFDLSGLTQPVLSFSHIFRTEDNCNCDFHWVEYSTDGQTWTKLGSTGSGTNWYDNTTYQAWKMSVTRWQVSSFDVPAIAISATTRFRVAMYADPGVNYEGVGIDDIHIFDKAAVYSGANIISGLTQNVSGNNWIHFNSGGNRVVSINPNGQDLGSTDVRVYINTGGVRNDGYQYYLDRNIVIQPTNAPAAPVLVRYYFLNTEINSLINATGCGTCSTISDAYAAGVTKYSNAPTEENGTIADNASGTYSFITPSAVDVIPYDNGYYAEYQVSNFSEFWINSGGPGQNRPLPLELGEFTATKNDHTALLQWTTLQETNTDQFIIERSTDGIGFTEIGTVAAAGNSSTTARYRFTDAQMAAGINYYRLKQTDKDGKFSYSPVRKLNNVDNDFTISITPNPIVKGVAYITTSVNCNRIELRDATGRLIKTANASGNNNQLTVHHIAKGLYFITVMTDSGKKVEKIFIE